MLTEEEVLKNMIQTNNDFVDSIKDVKHNINIINSKINAVNNTYFKENVELYNDYLNIYNTETLSELIKIINLFTEKINNNLNNICQHEWIYDDIDIGPEKSQRICYCKNCEISKNII